MTRNNHDIVVPTYMTSASQLVAPALEGSAGSPPGRLTLASVLPTIVFPTIGSVLILVGGMPMSQVFEFLAGCGAIGATVTVTVSGGRRIAAGLVRAAVAAAAADK
jgi:hypothetical protein